MIYTIKVTPTNQTEYLFFTEADNEKDAIQTAAEYRCDEEGLEEAATAKYQVIKIHAGRGFTIPLKKHHREIAEVEISKTNLYGTEHLEF